MNIDMIALFFQLLKSCQHTTIIFYHALSITIYLMQWKHYTHRNRVITTSFACDYTHNDKQTKQYVSTNKLHLRKIFNFQLQKYKKYVITPYLVFSF